MRREGENPGTSLPQKSGKIVVENWCYLPWVYSLEKEAEIPEIFGKKWRKCQFSKEIFIKNCNFLRIFKLS